MPDLDLQQDACEHCHRYRYRSWEEKQIHKALETALARIKKAQELIGA